MGNQQSSRSVSHTSNLKAQQLAMYASPPSDKAPPYALVDPAPRNPPMKRLAARAAEAISRGGKLTPQQQPLTSSDPFKLIVLGREAYPNLRSDSVEDPLDYLRRYDVVFVVDDSASMRGALWREARDALASIADLAAQYDADGVDIHFFNDNKVGENMRTSRQVKDLFDEVYPRGSTPTGRKLNELLNNYISELENKTSAGLKPINFLVITDGQPSDDPESVIVQAARRLDKGSYPLSQLGIQFVQIGRDPDAAEALRELDDDLAGRHGIRDIVDTVPYDPRETMTVLGSELLVKTLLGGINRRQDRRVL